MHTLDGIDKGQLVSPPMSDMSVDDLLSITVRTEREYLASDVWQEFSLRAREQHSLDITAPDVNRWRAILDQAPCVGSRPTLLVPYEPFGEEISSWTDLRDRPQEFNIEHVAGMPSGGGTGYMGTIDGVHVYELNGAPNRAILCSGRCLRSVTYQLLPNRNDLVDVSLEEGEDPERSQFRMRTAQVLDWSNDPILEFTWPPTQSAEP